ncbi:MAG: hypothetical protein ABGY96_08180, partial [bacterium]
MTHIQRIGRLFILGTVFFAFVDSRPTAAQTPADNVPTFSKDIVPILQRSCQKCHRPDSLAPM